jgi:hypothetical protein
LENRPSAAGKKEIAATVDKKIRIEASQPRKDTHLAFTIKWRLVSSRIKNRDMASIVGLIGIEASYQQKDTSLWLHGRSIGSHWNLGHLPEG